jgi:cytochrome c-type biogenesis protein CcmH/NrfG
MLLDRRRVKFWQRIVFGTLAAIFAISFVIGGVGSGTNFSISDIFNNGGGGGSTKVPSNVSKALAQTKTTPKSSAAWVSLAEAYQTQNETGQAIGAYTKAVQLDPKNAELRKTLASMYTGQAASQQQALQGLQAEAQSLNQTSPASSPFNATSALGSATQSPVAQAQSSQSQAAMTALEVRAQGLQAGATASYQHALDQYHTLTKQTPKDPDLWYAYGLTARSANQTATAVTALKHFLKLAPDDPNAAAVRAVIKQMQPAKH